MRLNHLTVSGYWEGQKVFIIHVKGDRLIWDNLQVVHQPFGDFKSHHGWAKNTKKSKPAIMKNMKRS